MSDNKPRKEKRLLRQREALLPQTERTARRNVSVKILPTAAQQYRIKLYKNTHTHPFNGPFSGTTRVGRYQKGKTNLDFTEARDSEWQWHQLGHMQVCTSIQTDNHASTSPLKFFTGRMPFLPPNQQRQSTEGKSCKLYKKSRTNRSNGVTWLQSTNV